MNTNDLVEGYLNEGAKDFAKKTAVSALKKGAVAGATALAVATATTAGRGIGKAAGDKITDVVTGRSRKRKRNNKKKKKKKKRSNTRDRRSRRGNKRSKSGRKSKRSKRRESVEYVDKLKKQNAQLREALRRTGIALVVANNLPKIEESSRKSFMESLKPHQSFESVVEFGEYVEESVNDFRETASLTEAKAKPRALKPAEVKDAKSHMRNKKGKKIAGYKVGSKVKMGGEDWLFYDAQAEDDGPDSLVLISPDMKKIVQNVSKKKAKFEVVEDRSDPVGIMNESNKFMFERIVMHQ